MYARIALVLAVLLLVLAAPSAAKSTKTPLAPWTRDGAAWVTGKIHQALKDGIDDIEKSAEVPRLEGKDSLRMMAYRKSLENAVERARGLAILTETNQVPLADVRAAWTVFGPELVRMKLPERDSGIFFLLNDNERRLAQYMQWMDSWLARARD
jgi:hypothetical protein